jgi:GNAT superfamily N-acetyltransferase
MPGLLEPISRLAAYGKRHGFRATLERGGLFVRRLFSSNRMVLFYLDFSSYAASVNQCSAAQTSGNLTFERKPSREEMAAGDWEQIVNFWNPTLSRRSFTERFQQGASLWLARCDGKLAGYGWTLTGRTIEPHYHPLGANDVHMFDFLVFPEFRGRNINPRLVDHILHQLAAEGRTRAYIEVREWNHPQLKSLSKTPFRLLGVARKRSVFGRTLVEWSAAPPTTVSQPTPVTAKNPDAANPVRLASR